MREENQEDIESKRPKFYFETTSHAEEKVKKDMAATFNALILPTFLATVVAVVAFFIENTALITWLAIIVVFIYSTFLLKYKYQASLKRTITSVIIIGLIVGLAIAITRLILGYKFYLIFNLLAEPALYAAIGALLSSLIYLVFKNKRKEVKNGRTKTNNTSSGSSSST